MNDDLQVDYIENDFYGKTLVAKNLSSPMGKFFNLDLMIAKNDILLGKGMFRKDLHIYLPQNVSIHLLRCLHSHTDLTLTSKNLTTKNIFPDCILAKSLYFCAQTHAQKVFKN